MDIYVSAFENSPDLIVCVNQEGKILRINRQAETKLGFEPSELIGAQVEILVPERLRTVHAGNLNKYFRSHAFRSPGAGTPLTARKKDGSEFPVEILLSPASTPQGDMVVAVLRDITEKQASESRFRELLGHLRMSSEAAGVGYWTYEEENERFWCDESFARLFGGRPADFPNLGAVEDRIHPEDREERRRRSLASLRKHGKYESEFRVSHPDGSQRWVADLGRYMEEGEKALQTFAGVALDITDRKAGEEKQAQLIRDLERSLRENHVLRGLLPICSHCKKIRDESDAWQPMESYIDARTEAKFSHGICPDCLQVYYSEFVTQKEC